MNVDTMRAVDKWAGIPLTFLLTQLHRLARFFGKRKPRTLRRILWIELSEMGSTILVDPALKKAEKELSAELFFLIFAKNGASLELTGTIAPENIFTLRENNIFLLLIDSCRFLLWARKNRIDTVIDLELFSRFTALLSGSAGADRRVGFYSFHNEGLYRGELLTHRVAYNPHIHIAKNFIALVLALQAERDDIPYTKEKISDEELVLPRFKCPEEDLLAMEERIGALAPEYRRGQTPLILINPNASELLPQRRWMPERFAALIGKILAQHEKNLVLITGAPSEKEEAAEMCARIGSKRCLNFAGALKLTELPILYTLATLMVTNDSGPGHFSAITPLPTFVLFGPETPKLYGSLGNSTPIFAGLACSPCVSAANHRKTPCHDNRCLQAIEVEEVYAALLPVLEKNSQPPL